jgi:hypothetical protein
MPDCDMSLREPEASQEGCLVALIGAGDEDQALAVRADVIADRPLACGQRKTDLVEVLAGEAGRVSFRHRGSLGQSDVVAVSHPDVLAFGRHARIAEFQSGAGEAAHMGDIGGVKLDLPVEPQDRPVEEIAASGREAVELRECLWIEPRDAIEDARLDVIHCVEVTELEDVIAGRALLEFLEVRLKLRPVVGFVAIVRDGDHPVADEERVANGGKLRLERRNFAQQSLKGRRAGVFREKSEEAGKSWRGRRRGAKIGEQTLDAP